MKKNVAVIAICDFISQPNGGEVYLLNNLFSANKDEGIRYYLIGMTFDPKMKRGEWTKIKLGDQFYDFFPIVKVTKDKEKTHIPFRLRCVQGLKKYYKKIVKVGIDEWYIHSAELGIPLRKKNCSVVYHVHGDPSQTLRISRFPIFRTAFWTNRYLSVIRKTMLQSRKIVWAARRSKELYLKTDPTLKDEVEAKSCVVHSSFDTKLKTVDTQLPIDKSKMHLVTVGRLSRVKRIDFIIDVFYGIINDGFDAELIICGDGEELNSLQKQVASYHLQDRVKFLGVANRTLLATVLDLSDVFLFASENEAMSLVVLESLYMGTPVVSTDVGDIPDAVIDGRSGYIIKDYNEVNYRKAAERILSDGKANYIEECKKIALEYTPEKMAQNINEVFR